MFFFVDAKERFFGDSEISAIFWGKIVATFYFSKPLLGGIVLTHSGLFQWVFFSMKGIILNLKLHRLQSEVGHVSVPADCWDQSEAVLVSSVQGLEKVEFLLSFLFSPTRSHFFSGDKDDEPYIVNIVLRIPFKKFFFLGGIRYFLDRWKGNPSLWRCRRCR